MILKKKISITVSDFALPSPKRGSIDTYSGFAAGHAFGLQIHKEIQLQRAAADSSYEAEVFCIQKFPRAKYIFEVSGIMDGVYHKSDFRIEEIKTAFDLNKLIRYIKDNESEHPYCLQLKTYGYIHWMKNKIVPELNLHLVSSRNRKSYDYTITLDIHEYESWLELRLQELVIDVNNAKKRIKKRSKLAKTLSFPFEIPRSGQIELIESVKEGMKENRPMLIQAPTGLGKTMGILYPALVEAMQRGQKVIYVTPKNSQHLVALDAVKNLQTKSPAIRSLTLTAKKKICMKQEPLCNAEYCEFAENHYTKVSENNLIEKLQRNKCLTSSSFQKIAEEYQVCPYELQMDMIPYVETVIGDYNYVFSPRASGSIVAKIGIGEDQKPNVVIDEAHNLPTRAMDYYSPGLSVVVLEKIGRHINIIPDAFRDKFARLLNIAIEIITNSAMPGQRGPHIIVPNVQAFLDHEAELKEFLAEYLESDVVIGPNDAVLGIYNYWMEFTAALEWVTSGKPEFFISYNPSPPGVKITCCDASEMLKSNYSEYTQVVGFSATLKPFDYYSQLIGLKTKKLKQEEFVSPFPKERRKIIIVPQISSKYIERERNYPRIAEAIHKISALKNGNYFAFFPSFHFLEQVSHCFTPPPGFNVIHQTRAMRQEQIKEILTILQEPGSANIIFAVQGGVFSEGMDYSGDLAIGAFVVGTPLPGYDWEREKMKAYYEQHYAAGLDYAYTYPAMAKAVQAAGRVIRSEKDKGIIVLMDSRFLQPNYYKCMPQDWFEADPKELVSSAILNDIRKFWHSVMV